MIKHMIDESLGHLSWHAPLHIFAKKIAIFSSQLAVFGDDEGDVLRHAGLPRVLVIFDFCCIIHN